jgi:hypothetical protein
MRRVSPFVLAALAVFSLALSACVLPFNKPNDPVPSVPSALRVTALTADSITIEWDAFPDASGYYVYWGYTATGTFRRVSTTPTTVCVHVQDKLPLGATRYFMVSAVVNGVETAKSAAVVGTTAGLPAPVANLVCPSAPTDRAVLFWDSVPTAQGYKVYRSTSGADGTWIWITGNPDIDNYTVGSPAFGGPAWSDIGLEAGTTYWYRVSAVNSDGEGEMSPVLQMTTAASVPTRSVFGTHTLLESADDYDATLDWVLALNGPGSYVKQMAYNIVTATPDMLSQFAGYVAAGDLQKPTEILAGSGLIKFVLKCYERDLIPVVRIHGYFGSSFSYRPNTDATTSWSNWIPPTGPGSFSRFGQTIKYLVQGLPRKSGMPLYIEIWNEPNLNGEWGGTTPNPTEYGYLLVASANAIREIGDDRIKVLNGGLSPGGNYNNIKFVKDMLSTVPASIDAFDVWSSHPYPNRTSPENNIHDNTAVRTDLESIDIYLAELAEIHKAGRTDVQMLATEMGYYRAEGGGVSESDFADFTVGTYQKYAAWPEVIGACHFILNNLHITHVGDTNGNGILDGNELAWYDRVFIKETAVDVGGLPSAADRYPVFDAVMAMPKPTFQGFPEFNSFPDLNMVIPPTSNLALSAVMTVSSTMDMFGWNQAFVNDGGKFGKGWTSEGDQIDEWVMYDFGSPVAISSVALWGRSDIEEGVEMAGKYFPQAFQVEASDDGTTWETLVTHDYGATIFEPAYTPVVINFEAVTNRYLRLYITRKTNHGSGGYHAQLAEFEVFAEQQ